MSTHRRLPPSLGLFSGFALRLVWLPGLLFQTACDTTMPSTRLRTAVNLPLPESAVSIPSEERLSKTSRGEKHVLSARSLIDIAFDLQPQIKSSYQRFRSEEARYDFFYASRDSLTPRVQTTGSQTETHDRNSVLRERTATVEFGVEKRFFDTTELDVAIGFAAGKDGNRTGTHPIMSARLRYPLWVSRQKLERTSEDIFRRNELNDAQLGYIQQVRRRLQDAMFKFYLVTANKRRVGFLLGWMTDLESLLEQIEALDGQRKETDVQRIRAEHTRVRADHRNTTGRFEIDVERLKSACGLPFHVELELSDEPFNPFEGADHAELMRLSIQSDPEISTLRNAVRNAEVQLDLARRGRWDLALEISGNSSLEGQNADDGLSDWSASIGLEVSAVDPRVTDSLIRQAQANIVRFSEAIAERENRVFVDTLEPLIRIDTLGTSRDELIENLPRFKADYQTGLDEFFAGKLNIDDLLKRRQSVFDQQREISQLKLIVGFNVAELCTATGKFFEMLNGKEGQGATGADG